MGRECWSYLQAKGTNLASVLRVLLSSMLEIEHFRFDEQLAQPSPGKFVWNNCSRGLVLGNSSIGVSLQACNATVPLNRLFYATALDLYGLITIPMQFLGTSVCVPLLISGHRGLILAVATLRPYCSTISTKTYDVPKSETRDASLAPRRTTRRHAKWREIACKSTSNSHSVQYHWLPLLHIGGKAWSACCL